MKLYTIGYEGSDVQRLIETLKIFRVSLLADVRELPLSRKPGLSKNGLAAHLLEAGIDYRNFKQLGDPKPGREAARAGDYQAFETIYLNHLASEPAQLALDDLIEASLRQTACLLCFERCAQHCHRSYIADVVANRGFEVFNLTCDEPEKYLEHGTKLTRYNPRESLAAAQ